MNKIISIIIPLYNSEKYISDCLETTIAQDLSTDSYEVIVVNDGSSDNGPAIVKDYIDKYPFIRMVSQPNLGLSEARNTGIEQAQGDYVVLLDSDDWLGINCLNKISSLCEKYDLDLLRFCGANVINGEAKRRFSIAEGGVKEGKAFLDIDIHVAAPFTVYKKAFLKCNNLRFYPGIFHEDIDFTPRAYYYAKKVYAINDICYYVRQTPGSITRSVNVKKALDLVFIISRTEEFYKVVSKDVQLFFHDRIGATLNLAMHQALAMNPEQKKAIEEAIYGIRNTFYHLKKSSLRRYRVEWLLFNLFPQKTIRLFRVMMFFSGKKKSN